MATLMGRLAGGRLADVRRGTQRGHPQLTVADLLGSPLPGDLVRAEDPKDIRVATAWFKPKYNLTDIVPDYYINDTDQWLVFPHELEGLTREEIFTNKKGMKKLFEDAELD